MQRVLSAGELFRLLLVRGRTLLDLVARPATIAQGPLQGRIFPVAAWNYQLTTGPLRTCRGAAASREQLPAAGLQDEARPRGERGHHGHQEAQVRAEVSQKCDGLEASLCRLESAMDTADA